MLDTNICVDLLRGRGRSAAERLKTEGLDSVCISVVTLAELLYGAHKSRDPERNERAVVDLCASMEVAPFNDLAAAMYGRLRANLEKVGKPIGPLDTLIASNALSLGLMVVTDNEREFRRVANLRVENWLARC